MNLGRAKLIFIIAFTGLNLFLGYNLFWPDYGRFTNVSVTAEDLRLTEALLNNYNYILGAPISRAVKTGNFLTVAHSAAIMDDFNQYYAENASVKYSSEEITYYRMDGELALAHANGLLQIFYENGIELFPESTSSDERELRNKVREFLIKFHFDFPGLQYDYIEQADNDKYILYYYQLANDVPLFASQLKVVVSENAIIQLDIYWLDVFAAIAVREMEVIPVTEALTNLVKGLGPSVGERKVTRVDLGYFSGEFDAEKWEVPSVWRIMVDDSHCYYINAFTGNQERDTIIPEQLP